VRMCSSNSVLLLRDWLWKKFLPLTFTVVCRQFKQEEVEEVSLCDQARSGRAVAATDKSH
jgi:hypothetical protein